ncbi:hypothetical protein BaRGS_00010613 [Batillaria attramentaria]|uniref:Uncharacterized protein n=1 Tax=Batillaria attramentaria TaxID=370345 RepID=A0ABD0LF81_9CAEN
MWKQKATYSVTRELNLVAAGVLLSVLMVNAFTMTTSPPDLGTQTSRDHAEGYSDKNDMADRTTVESPTKEGALSGWLLPNNYLSDYAIPVYGFLYQPVAFIVFLGREAQQNCH